MGKKNYLFAWTELGAKHIGIIQSLIATCRLQGLSPTVYLTDVLQRVSEHPARDVVDLTPRRWKVPCSRITRCARISTGPRLDSAARP